MIKGADFDELVGFSDLFAIHSRGRLSFPDFWNWRRQCLADLASASSTLQVRNQVGQQQSHDASFPLLYGPGVDQWVGSQSDITWISPPPLIGRIRYPYVLDIMEWAGSQSSESSLRVANRALAPTWEELCSTGIVGAISIPRWDDIQGGQGEDLIERYTLSQSALVLASLGPRFGLYLQIFRIPDRSTVRFLRRLGQYSRTTGFKIAIACANPQIVKVLFLDVVRKGQATFLESTYVDHLHERQCDIKELQLVSIAPSGLPRCAFAKLTGREEPVDCRIATHTSTNSEDHRFYVRPNSQGLSVKREQRKQLAGMVADAWPTNGWNYIRRAAYPLIARNVSTACFQHTAFTYGLSSVGRSCLVPQFFLLGTQSKHKSIAAVYATIGAARLLHAVRGNDAAISSISLYRSVITQGNSITRALIVYSIANIYAHLGTDEGVTHAEELITAGLSELKQIQDDADRVHAHIRLLNGLALVRYRQGRELEALLIESKALAAASKMRSSCPELWEWASPIIRANIARVYEKRLGDPDRAIKSLNENLKVNHTSASEHARIEIARMHFDAGRHREAIDVLSFIYDDVSRHSLDDRRELLARLILAVSHCVIGQPNRGQKHACRIASLCSSLESVGASEFLNEMRSERAQVAV